MTVHAPYAFIPLSKWIYRPAWGELVSHDVPFDDGVSGSFEIKFLAVTPLLVGGARRAPIKEPSQAGTVWPHQDGNGKVLIPGSSLQGMVRSIVEIAAFGRMRFVDADRRFGQRDLSRSARPIYQNRLTPSAKSIATSKVQAGWLRRGPNGLELYPCEWAKIEVHIRPAIPRPGSGMHVPQSIEGLLPATAFIADHWRAKRDLFKALPGGGSETRYDLFPPGFSLAQTFEVDDSPQDYDHCKAPPRARTLFIRYRRVWANHIPGKTAPQPGHVVLTGSPGPNKHMEFFFYFRGGAVLPPKTTGLDEPFRLFMELHEPQDGRKENPNWAYYRDYGYPAPPIGAPGSFIDGGAMPIFYLEEGGAIVGIGLASMFKLPHRATVRQLMTNTNAAHAPAPAGQNDDERHDFATLLFGAEADRNGLKRRVSFDLARSEGRVNVTSLGEQLLNTPKPSYYPSYVRQPHQNADDDATAVINVNGAQRRRPYASYTPLKTTEISPRQLHVREHEFPEISGFKVYPAEATRPRVDLPDRSAPTEIPEDPDDNGEMEAPGAHLKNNLYAAPAGTVFQTVVRFHNLRKIELGALLWALTFGDENAVRGTGAKWRHRLGTGKPLGLGETIIRVVSNSVKLTWNNNASAAGGVPALVDALRAFVSHMNEEFRAAGARGNATWSTSEQIRTLHAAADPTVATPENRPYRLAYMSAGEHSEAKGTQHSPNFHFLRRYLPNGDDGPLEQDAFPR